MASSHQAIDARLYRLVAASIRKIEGDMVLRQRLAENVARWSNASLRTEWVGLLALPWPELRSRLLEESEAGAALRQNAPLGGVLSSRERMAIMQEFADDARAA